MSLRFRSARLDDALLLLGWRNDLETVRWSVDPRPVELGNHLSWLERVLMDETRRLVVVVEKVWGGAHGDTLCAEYPVGTYRLDHVGSALVEVSLTVAPGHRGRGLAVEFIEAACDHARRLGADAYARAHKGNARSLRAFLRAGFVLDGFNDPLAVLHRSLRGGESQ